MLANGDTGGMSQPDDGTKFGYFEQRSSSDIVFSRMDSGVPLHNPITTPTTHKPQKERRHGK